MGEGVAIRSRSPYVELAPVKKSRAALGEGVMGPSIKVGICGEHGGDPASIAFCEGIGLDYVSCSPLPPADRRARRGAGGN